MQPLLAIEHLTKVFPGQVALDDVSVTINSGRTHALVGQNGSGKSTLIKILAGYHQPTAGSATVYRSTADDEPHPEPFTLGDAHEAIRAGIRFVHQDLALVDSLSAVENLAMTTGFTTGRLGRIKWRVDERRAKAALEDLGFDDFSIKSPVGSLAPSQKTAVAVARALQGWEHGASLLVLDEPTASLPDVDVQRLFEAVRRLKARGVAILYVSHHLDEVFEIADEVTVLRDGRLVTTCPVTDLDHDKLIELVIGRKLELRQRQPRESSAQAPLLRTVGLCGGNVAALDLAVAPGEVVGVAGITGSGREHVVALLTGEIPSIAGWVHINGNDVSPYRPSQVMAAGGAFVSADRGAQGIFAPLSVTANTTISDLTRHTTRGRLLHKRERAEAQEWSDRLSVRSAGTEAPIASLSGGNQQKVLFARGLRLEPSVLMLDEPTRGVDVGAKEEIHAIIDRAAAGGAAIVVASTDTDELVRVSHRVIVLRLGVVCDELTGDDITVEHITHSQSAVAAATASTA